MDHKEKTLSVLTKAPQEYNTFLPNQRTMCFIKLVPMLMLLIDLKKQKNLLELWCTWVAGVLTKRLIKLSYIAMFFYCNITLCHVLVVIFENICSSWMFIELCKYQVNVPILWVFIYMLIIFDSCLWKFTDWDWIKLCLDRIYHDDDLWHGEYIDVYCKVKEIVRNEVRRLVAWYLIFMLKIPNPPLSKIALNDSWGDLKVMSTDNNRRTLKPVHLMIHGEYIVVISVVIWWKVDSYSIIIWVQF